VRYRILSLALIFAVCAGLAHADGDWPDEKDPVKVTLVIILASEKGDKVDKHLKMLAQEVQKTHPHLKSFTSKTQMSPSLKPNEKTSLLCVDDQMVEMLVKHGADKDNLVSVAIKAPMMSPLEYKSVCGKFLPIVTPYKTKKKGETLILAIKLEPCLRK
jgi:hypothetical protein